MKELNIDTIKKASSDLALIIDTRPTEFFVNGFIKGAINIVLNQNFEARASFFSKIESVVFLIARPEDKEQIEAITDEDLKKKIEGIHYGTFEDWIANSIELDMIINVDPYELRLDMKHDDKAIVLDVRTNIQYDEEHIVGAVNMQMTDFNDNAKISTLDEKNNFYLHCNGGTRSVLTSSILKRNGFHNIRNIEGGFKAVVNDW